MTLTLPKRLKVLLSGSEEVMASVRQAPEAEVGIVEIEASTVL